MTSQDIGRSIIGLGIVILVIGAAFYFSDRLPFLKSIGRLPGDFSWRGNDWQVHAPIMTSILLSVALTAVFWIISYFRSRGGS